VLDRAMDLALLDRAIEKQSAVGAPPSFRLY
jgi:hypothetical protein